MKASDWLDTFIDPHGIYDRRALDDAPFGVRYVSDPSGVMRKAGQ